MTVNYYRLESDMGALKKRIASRMLDKPPIMRGRWQAEDTDLQTFELKNFVLEANIGSSIKEASDVCGADQPWAETHFQERISGQPLNPAPSYVDWPWHSRAEAERHVKDSRFSHTYPERIWPRFAGEEREVETDDNVGIRYVYGDLDDVIKLLQNDPFTRQAYLPIWFPEDTGAVAGQRVPCTLGYHFIRNGPFLDVNYFLRSCDLTRHFHNDVYFTARLLQHIVSKVAVLEENYMVPFVGDVTMFVSNLHLFKNDAWRYL